MPNIVFSLAKWTFSPAIKKRWKQNLFPWLIFWELTVIVQLYQNPLMLTMVHNVWLRKTLVVMYTLLQSVIMCYIWHTWLLWSIGFSSDLRFSPSVAYSTCNIIRQNSWESCKIWKKTNQPYTFYYELTILYKIYI